MEKKNTFALLMEFQHSKMISRNVAEFKQLLKGLSKKKLFLIFLDICFQSQNLFNIAAIF